MTLKQHKSIRMQTQQKNISEHPYCSLVLPSPFSTPTLSLYLSLSLSHLVASFLHFIYQSMLFFFTLSCPFRSFHSHSLDENNNNEKSYIHATFVTRGKVRTTLSPLFLFNEKFLAKWLLHCC